MPSKPTALTKATGSWRIIERKNEVTPEIELPDVPTNAIKSVDALNMYREIGSLLVPLGLCTKLDGMKLATLCNAYVDYCRLGDTIEVDGYFCYAGNGTKIPNPAVGMRNNAWSVMFKLAREFGMTPSARAGLAVDMRNKKPDDKHDDFFKVKSA